MGDLIMRLGRGLGVIYAAACGLGMRLLLRVAYVSLNL
jgi:hypothetical protein